MTHGRWVWRGRESVTHAAGFWRGDRESDLRLLDLVGRESDPRLVDLEGRERVPMFAGLGGEREKVTHAAGFEGERESKSRR